MEKRAKRSRGWGCSARDAAEGARTKRDVRCTQR